MEDKNKGKKLLFISSRPLYPIIGGDQIRTVQQLDFLKERFDVDVLYLTPDDKDLSCLDNSKSGNKVFRVKVGKIKSIIQTLRFLFNKLPLQVNYYYNKLTRTTIDSIIDDYKYVFCNNIRTAEYVRKKKNIVKYLDFVDAISMNYDKARYKAKGLRKLMYAIDCDRCKSYEQKCLDSFDSCAVISDIDKEFILCQK